MYVCLSINRYVYIYIYICYKYNVYIYIYTCIYIEREREIDRERERDVFLLTPLIDIEQTRLAIEPCLRLNVIS